MICAYYEIALKYYIYKQCIMSKRKIWPIEQYRMVDEEIASYDRKTVAGYSILCSGAALKVDYNRYHDLKKETLTDYGKVTFEHVKHVIEFANQYRDEWSKETFQTSIDITQVSKTVEYMRQWESERTGLKINYADMIVELLYLGIMHDVYSREEMTTKNEPAFYRIWAAQDIRYLHLGREWELDQQERVVKSAGGLHKQMIKHSGFKEARYYQQELYDSILTAQCSKNKIDSWRYDDFGRIYVHPEIFKMSQFAIVNEDTKEVKVLKSL